MLQMLSDAFQLFKLIDKLYCKKKIVIEMSRTNVLHFMNKEEKIIPAPIYIPL